MIIELYVYGLEVAEISSQKNNRRGKRTLLCMGALRQTDSLTKELVENREKKNPVRDQPEQGFFIGDMVLLRYV